MILDNDMRMSGGVQDNESKRMTGWLYNVPMRCDGEMEPSPHLIFISDGSVGSEDSV